jgi:hypothetical protein
VQDAEELVVVEFENASNLPFALALAVRPYNPEGLAVVERIALHDRAVTVDGRPALLFSRPPSRAAGSTFRQGDAAAVVFRGEAGETLPDPLRCQAGLALAAFLFPLAHGATLHAALPLVAERRTRRRRLARRRVERMPELPAGGLPASAVVARAWRAQTDRGMRLVVPDARLAEAVDANRRYLLLLHDGPEITPGPATYHRFWFRDAAYMLAALDRYGFHREAAEVITHFKDRQRVDGFFFSQRQEWDSNGAALWTIAEHWRLTGELVADADSISRAVRWIGRKLRSGRRRPEDPGVDGLMPAGISAEHLGPFDHYYWDSFWSLRGLIDGAAMLRHLGREKQAAAARAWADGLRAALDASMAHVATVLGTEAVPAGPHRRLDPGMIGSLVACWPLELLPADDGRIAATADVIRDRFCIGDAFFQGISHTGLGTYLTMQVAAVELAAGDRRALARLSWLLGAATPTWTWPEAIHPQLGGGCMGDGHHGWAAADFLSMVRSTLVREVEGGLALCSMIPDHWFGQGIEVHDAPTHAGLLSFAVRWHGERPALLWELQRRDASQPVTLTVPGLDPAWSTTEDRGEALLASPPALRASAAGGFT